MTAAERDELAGLRAVVAQLQNLVRGHRRSDVPVIDVEQLATIVGLGPDAIGSLT